MKKLLLVSLVPPHNDCGVRIVMYRHLVERSPFDLHVVSPADFDDDLLIHTRLTLPGPLQRLRKSRFGPRLSKWLQDYENLVWPRRVASRLQKTIDEFQPDVILTLAETGLCHMAAKAAKNNDIPLVGLFLDWFPIMPPRFGHSLFKGTLSRRYRNLYRQCDLAICTSDGMKEELGPHQNSHVIYPMPGSHSIAKRPRSDAGSRAFRLVYVGSAQGFYGRMLRRLLKAVRGVPDLELVIVGPTNDWPSEELCEAEEEGSCLGFMPPDEASEILVSADALLVTMSFEPDRELFMRTSFTTKFLDYVAFGKPVILWGPDYCTPSKVAAREEAAIIVNDQDEAAVVNKLCELRDSPSLVSHYSSASTRLASGLFCPDRLQSVFVNEILNLIND